MAADCLGCFGAHKLAYSRHLNGEIRKYSNKDGVETVWVTKRYIPTDLRHTAPVPRHKLLAPSQLPSADRHWVPIAYPALRTFCRNEDMQINAYKSHPSSRCEEWSTLRQMLPSTGTPFKPIPPNWGTSQGIPPLLERDVHMRHPNISSPMTKYVDDMHLTNRLFKLH